MLCLLSFTLEKEIIKVIYWHPINPFVSNKFCYRLERVRECVFEQMKKKTDLEIGVYIKGLPE